MEENQRKRLVFFYRNKKTITDGLKMYLSLAKYISNHRHDYEVYYINYYNEQIEMFLENSQVIFKDYECSNVYAGLSDAIFVTQSNYLQILVNDIASFSNAQIMLLDWNPKLIRYLLEQYDDKKKNAKELFDLLENTHSWYFSDKNCFLDVKRHFDVGGGTHYIPMPTEKKENSVVELREYEDVIRIGWVGELNNERKNSILNLLYNIENTKQEITVNIQIIGDNSVNLPIKLQQYSENIQFTFVSMPDNLEEYLHKNIDLVIATGKNALDCGLSKLPVIVPYVSEAHFYTNKYVFLNDVTGYSLECTKSNIRTLDYRNNTIDEILEQIKDLDKRCEIGNKCFEHVLTYHSLEYSSTALIEAIQRTSLSVGDCLQCPTIMNQAERFKEYTEESGNDFDAYISIVKKENLGRKLTKEAQIKHLLKDVLWGIYAKKVINLLRLGLKYKSYNKIQKEYEAKLVQVRNRLNREGKLKVAFIVIFESVFPARPIFEKMLQDSMFDPYIIVTTDIQRGVKHKLEKYHQSLEFFETKYPGKVIRGYDEEWDYYIELKEEYPLVCFANPYIKMVHPFHELQYFLNKDVLTLYVNYGFAAVKYGRTLMKLDFYNYVWKVFLDSEINKRDLKKHQPIKARNAIATSYIKMDELASVDIDKRERKRILICPHHTVMGWKALDISNFMKYSELFVELPKIYPDVDFIFRPHPLLFSNLINNNIWTEEQIKAYLGKMLSSTNIVYDVSGDYFKTFANSDGMIHDCSSFIGEYLFTEKPCCYMLKSEEQIKDIFLPMGEMCMDNYYKAFSEEEILRFIDDVIIAEKDPLKEKREKFSREVLKFNYPHSAEYVVDYIKTQINGKTQ